MDARDQALAQLALALRLVDAAGMNRAARLSAQFPGKGLDRLLLEAGLITVDGHRQLVATFEERLRAARAQLAGGRPAAGPPAAGAPGKALPGKAPPGRAPPAAGAPGKAPPVAAARPGGPPPKRLVVPMDSDAALPTLAVPDDDEDALPGLTVPDDDRFDPDDSDEVPVRGAAQPRGRRAPPAPVDEEELLAEPTMIVRDDAPAEDATTVLPDAESTTVLSERELADEEELLAEPTMIVRDDGGRGAPSSPAPPDEEELLAEPTMIVRDGGPGAGPSDEEALLAEPTMVLATPPEDEDAILAQPTMVLQDGGDDEALLGQPTVVLEDGPRAAPGKDDSGLHLKLAKDVPSDPKRQAKGPALAPGVKSKKGEGPLDREEFQRRLKMRQGFEGFTIGDYKIMGEIARGAFGVVLEAEPGGTTKALARERGYQGRLALKVMLENKADPRETQRFLDEVRVLIRFDHPHIVRMFDAGVENGLTYYSMELIRGVECRSYVLKHGPMPPLLAVRVCKEVASALAYVHAQRAYHRDLKPQNVMLDQSTQPYRTLLIDFGLVTEHLSTEDKGLILGTPSYMPPEQAQPRGGHGEINVTSDIYSLGATLYYLLTGQAPFPGKDPRAIIKAVVAEKPRDPCELKPEVPRRVADICLKCLEKKQRDRYHAARLLEADLDAALKSGQMMLKAKSLFGKIIGKRKEP